MTMMKYISSSKEKSKAGIVYDHFVHLIDDKCWIVLQYYNTYKVN